MSEITRLYATVQITNMTIFFPQTQRSHRLFTHKVTNRLLPFQEDFLFVKSYHVTSFHLAKGTWREEPVLVRQALGTSHHHIQKNGCYAPVWLNNHAWEGDDIGRSLQCYSHCILTRVKKGASPPISQSSHLGPTLAETTAILTVGPSQSSVLPLSCPCGTHTLHGSGSIGSRH